MAIKVSKKLKAMLLDWEQMQIELKELKEKEMELRREIVGIVFKDNNELKARTQLVIHDDGEPTFKFKIEKSTTTSVHNLTLETFKKFLPSIRKCFRVKFELDKRAFNNLPLDKQNFVEDFIIEKPAAPTITVSQIENDD